MKLILYINQFFKRIKFQIKEGELNSGYLIKNEFLIEIKKLKISQIILDYISKNKTIHKILNECPEEDFNSVYQKVLKEFNYEITNKINNDKSQININTDSFEAKYDLLKLNTNNWTYIVNNCIILNKEIYKLFASKQDFYCNTKFNYFYGKNKIFILVDKY